jgi:hypothetical protein
MAATLVMRRMRLARGAEARGRRLTVLHKDARGVNRDLLLDHFGTHSCQTIDSADIVTSVTL